jgi:hypothetical protein
MSWTVDGRMYHDWAAYQRARARSNKRRASRAGSRARETERRLQAQIQKNDAELSRVRGDVAAQTRLNAEIRRDVGALQRNQRRLDHARLRLESDMESQFAQARQHFAQQEQAIETMQSDHASHVASVQQQFSRVKDELAQGLAQAERRRLEGEERLQGAIRDVSARVDAEREARLATARTQRDRAERLLKELEVEQSQIDPAEATRLGMRDRVQGVLETHRGARTLLAQGDQVAALARAMGGVGELRTLRQELLARTQDIVVARDDARARAGRLAERVRSEPIAQWFGTEVELARQVLTRVKNEINAGYRDHASLPVQIDRHNRWLEALETEVDGWDVAAPQLADLASDRNEQIVGVVMALKRAYGPVARTHQRLVDSRDPKSGVVLQLDFGGPRVDVHAGLDGRLQVDGYGHDSNRTCAARGQRSARELAGSMSVDNARQELDNRQEPNRTNDGRDQVSWWQGARDRLETLRRG